MQRLARRRHGTDPRIDVVVNWVEELEEARADEVDRQCPNGRFWPF